MEDQMLCTLSETAREAGEKLLEYFGHLHSNEIVHKGKTDLVSVADRTAEQLIRAKLNKAYPEIGFHGEESGGVPFDQGKIFETDPLDGTNNFIHGMPLFCVSLAYVENGVSQAGVVYAPLLNELFSAKRGEGAWLNGKPLHVSTVSNLIDAEVESGYSCVRAQLPKDNAPIIEELVHKVLCVRVIGSFALSLCWLAAGRFDAAWELKLGPWDWAAGKLLVEEAGGKVTDVTGAPLDWHSGRILASNGLIHAPLTEAIAKYF